MRERDRDPGGSDFGTTPQQEGLPAMALSEERYITVVADADRGPVFSEQVVGKISEVLVAPVVMDYATDHGNQHHVVLNGESFRLTLVSYSPFSPYMILGDAEVQYVVRTGAPATPGGVQSFNMRGLSAIEIGPGDVPFVRFVQRTEQQWTRLILHPDGATSVESQVQMHTRHR